MTLLSTLLSFLMGGLPKLLEFFQDRSDKQHELALAAMQIERELTLKKAGLEVQERIEAIHTEQIQINADVANAQTVLSERQALYAHDTSLNEGTSTWVKNLRASVRPVITYGFFFLLVFVDIGLFVYGWRNGATFTELADMLWDAETQTLFASIIAFHFGGRAFGK